MTGWAGRTVLVTGATGLLGSALVPALLKSGADVVCLIRDADPQSELFRSGTVKRVSIVNGSLEEYVTVERAVSDHEVDTVFHLGAQTLVGSALRSPLQTFESNIRGSYNLLEACRVHKGMIDAVVIASSDKAYGDRDELPYLETMAPQGKHPYDVSKSCTDLIATSYVHTYRLPVIVTRFGNLYGGGDLNWSRIVPGTIRSYLDGVAPVLRSDGHSLRDYVYVQDAALAYLRFAEALHDDCARYAGSAYNFGPSAPVSVIDLVKLIAEQMGGQEFPPVIANSSRSEIRHQYLDSSKAARELGIAPSTPLQQGLKETIEWYRNYRENQ